MEVVICGEREEKTFVRSTVNMDKIIFAQIVCLVHLKEILNSGKTRKWAQEIIIYGEWTKQRFDQGYRDNGYC